ncbi:MAG TPA: type III polyketide synthase [Caulobacteraceae bacterium]|jgi:predicted naringenin-chalcone synthase
MAAYLNRIATAVPEHDVHEPFVQFAETLLTDRRSQVLFRRMADRSQIEHRFSTVQPRPLSSNSGLDTDDFYVRGAFPSTAQRMQRFEDKAPALALKAAHGLNLSDEDRDAITHVIVTTCTGFSAPGLDLQLVEGLGLKPQTERTIVGFMGCYAAISALKLARHVVRSEPQAKVLVVSLELCTLHLQETSDLEQVLTFLVFGDGCAAALVSAEPTGLELESFHAEVVPAAADQITWGIGDGGFDMYLSGQVPASIRHALDDSQARILKGSGVEAFDLWAIHPGGRTVLDAVEAAFSLPPKAMAASREVLRRFGNMSSATVLFVLKALIDEPGEKGARGCAMAFGPGLTAETMLFSQA